ncbi:MAG: FAD-binding protein [Clostridia bacterium]|nr:FAD-binding protein [Clostridia bacterium]
MKNRRIFAWLLVVVMILPVAANAEATARHETFTAQENGFGGAISVTLTVSDGRITGVVIDGDSETQGIGSRAVEQLPAVMVEKGDPDVDALTGATISSNAIIRAAKAAYAEATGAAKTEVNMMPGTYEEKVWGYSQAFQLPVKVTVDEKSIISIEVPDSMDELDEHGETFVIFQTVIDYLIPRILEHQSFAVDAVTGATTSSNAVKQAVEMALTEALAAGGSSPDAISAFSTIPAKAEEGQVEQIDVDLLTVGLGNAGIMASKHAVEILQEQNGGQPVSFMGIEKAAKIGGQSGMAHAIFAVNPERYQEENNNGEDYLDEEQLLEYWLNYTTGADGSQRAKPAVLEMYLDRSGELIDWLRYDHDYVIEGPTGSNMSEGEHDVTFVGEYNLVSFNYSYEQRRLQVFEWQKQLMEQIEAAGGSYLLETEGYEFVYDEDTNTVKGVKARDLVTGKEYVINAKAVIMATGGFGGGELTNELYSDDPYPLRGEYKQYGMAQNDGKMFSAALDIGAGTWNAGMTPILIGIASLAGEIHDYPVNLIEGTMNNRTGRTNTWSLNDIPEGFISYTNVMYFDKNGNRNAAEPVIGTGKNNEVNQYYWYGPSYYVLIDDAMVKQVQDEGFPVGTRWRQYTSQGGVPLETPLPETYDVMQKAIDMGFVFKADTIEDLARQLDIDPATLRATFDRYQSFCENGVDEDYGKDPSLLREYEQTGPYYAVQAFPYPYGSTGGLDVDEQLRVLKSDGETPIHGLYAVGGDSLGVILNDEKNYLSLGGPANGWAYTSGYVSGENAANYIIEGLN